MTPQEQNALNLERWQHEREMQRAAVKLATVQAENRRLRKMTRNGKAGRLLHQAAVDAAQLVGWRFADYSVSRRAAESYSMPRRRWEWGVAMLRWARVIDRSADVWLDDAFVVTEPAEAQRLIDAAVESLRNDDDGLTRLRRAMPRWATAGKPKGKPAGYALG